MDPDSGPDIFWEKFRPLPDVVQTFWVKILPLAWWCVRRIGRIGGCGGCLIMFGSFPWTVVLACRQIIITIQGSSQDSCLIWADPTDSHGDCQHDLNTPIVFISSTCPPPLVSESNFCMLLFVYQLSFSGSLNPCLSLSLSTAASIYGYWGWLLPTLATRGAGNALKVTLVDMTCTRSETITTNTEHIWNVISAVSSALIVRNRRRGENRSEKKEEAAERRGRTIFWVRYSDQLGCLAPSFSVDWWVVWYATSPPSVQAHATYGLVSIGDIAVLACVNPVCSYKWHLVLYPILWELV